MAHARISRVRLKDGGAEIRILARKERSDCAENWNGRIVSAARSIGGSKHEIVGYIVIGMYEDGSYSMGSRIDNNRCAIPLTLLPSYVGDIIRRDIINDHDTRRIIDEDYVRT